MKVDHSHSVGEAWFVHIKKKSRTLPLQYGPYDSREAAVAARARVEKRHPSPVYSLLVKKDG